MSGEQASLAVVLRSVAYGEADAILTLLTRDFGKLTVFARGARSSRRPRFGVTLEPFMHLEVRWRPRKAGSMPTVVTVDIVETFDGLRSDYDRIAWASYAVEVARESVHEGDEAGLIYRLLTGYLTGLSRRGVDLDDRVAFELALLASIGVAPRLGACVRCGEERTGERRYRLSSRLGGILCDRCDGSVEAPLSALAIEAVADIAGTIPPVPPELGIPASERGPVAAAIPTYVEECLGKELKTLPFLAI